MGSVRMSHAGLLQRVIAELDRAGIPFMIAGSVASGYHGESRSTYDIDIVIEADLSQVVSFIGGLSDTCYVSLPAAQEAVLKRTMFNVIDLDSGIKADFIVRKNRPFSIAEFRRREPAKISGVDAFVVSAEDCILSKLEWSQMGESERQFRDALKIAEFSKEPGELDLTYLRHWAQQLKIEILLERLLSEAGLA
jgi:hypothetical protein